MTLECVDALACGGAPNPTCLVTRARCHQRRVVREDYRCDDAHMALKLLQTLTPIVIHAW